MAIGLLALSFGLGVYTGLAGAPVPPGPPGSTSSHTLEDIYNRLDTGAAGTQSGFAEPASGPGTGTMHTLDDIMAIAPAADNTDGAQPAEVLAGKTFWSLRTNLTWGLQTGTAPPAPVPRTGVTATLAISDDGALQTGVAWPNPRFTVHDNGTPQFADDTVTDNLTGLMWTRNADHGLTMWKFFDSYPALEYCNTLEVGEYDDWRLPNVREMQSLLHFGFSGPTVPNTAGTGQWTTDGDPFIDVRSDYYWSSSTVAGSPLSVWYVDLVSGLVANATRTHEYYVWPVRGGQ
jgi:hypothetical protein